MYTVDERKYIVVKFKFDSLFSRLCKSTCEAGTLLYRSSDLLLLQNSNQLKNEGPADNIP